MMNSTYGEVKTMTLETKPNSPEVIVHYWKDVLGYEGQYEVSNTGKVRKITKDGYKMVKQYLIGARREYRYVSFSKNGRQQIYLVHRLVAEAFIGLPPKVNPDGTEMRTSPEINHKDGCGSNNHVSNLEWCDRYYNNQHRKPSPKWNKEKYIEMKQAIEEVVENYYND